MTTSNQPSPIMRPMTDENGQLKGWYLDHPEFYCDIEKDATGQWEVFFREHKTGREAFAEVPIVKPDIASDASS